MLKIGCLMTPLMLLGIQESGFVYRTIGTSISKNMRARVLLCRLSSSLVKTFLTDKLVDGKGEVRGNTFRVFYIFI